MRVDMRVYQGTRDAVHAGIAALRVQGRQIWDRPIPPGIPAGGWKVRTMYTLPEIVIRLTVGVGDLARLARSGRPEPVRVEKLEDDTGLTDIKLTSEDLGPVLEWDRELKKELGNIIFSTIRWVDDLGLDVLECLDLAIEAQEKFANSGRPR